MNKWAIFRSRKNTRLHLPTSNERYNLVDSRWRWTAPGEWSDDLNTFNSMSVLLSIWRTTVNTKMIENDRARIMNVRYLSSACLSLKLQMHYLLSCAAFSSWWTWSQMESAFGMLSGDLRKHPVWTWSCRSDQRACCTNTCKCLTHIVWSIVRSWLSLSIVQERVLPAYNWPDRLYYISLEWTRWEFHWQQQSNRERRFLFHTGGKTPMVLTWASCGK